MRQIRAATQSKWHLILALVWMALAVPTMLVWRHSIMWVAFMSLYANFVGHWGAYQASRVEVNNDNSDCAST